MRFKKGYKALPTNQISITIPARWIQFVSPCLTAETEGLTREES
jgi:hypothetical protein